VGTRADGTEHHLRTMQCCQFTSDRDNIWSLAANFFAPVQRRSLLGGYPGHDALPYFLRKFSKTPDNYVETDCTSERFFDGNLIS
jgi:hypothetical protein